MQPAQRLAAVVAVALCVRRSVADGISACYSESNASCERRETSNDETPMIQVQRRPSASRQCSVGDHVQCPGTGVWCAGAQCCPSEGKGTYPCPSAPHGWGKGKCQRRKKKSDCLPSLASPLASPPANDMLQVPIFWWSVHHNCVLQSTDGFQCGDKPRPSPECGMFAKTIFTDFVQDFGAQVAAALQIFPNEGELLPYNFTTSDTLGDSFTQVNGHCPGTPNDQVALLFGPGWAVQNQTGGCLPGGPAGRAFAAAKVTPPRSVAGCTSGLCVVAGSLHFLLLEPKYSPVPNWCGNLTDKCTLAFGGFSADISPYARASNDSLASASPRGLQTLNDEPDPVESQLTVPPGVAGFEPQDFPTCCYLCGDGYYDGEEHLISNVPKANATYELLPYQITEQNAIHAHKPVFVNLSLPAA